MSLSFYKYILYLKFLNYKTNYFISNNKIEFIISHYKENFDYLKYLPNNQKITIYIKSNIKPPINKKNIKIVFLENVISGISDIFISYNQKL